MHLPTPGLCARTIDGGSRGSALYEIATCDGESEREEYGLLAITGEIVDTRTLAIFFFGSLTPLILVISALCT